MKSQQAFHGPNAGYILELYEKYRVDPQSVDEETRSFFESWGPPDIQPVPPVEAPQVYPAETVGLDLEKVVAAANLAQAVRSFGYLAASLDPLGASPPGDPSLDPAFHGLSEADLQRLPTSLIEGPAASGMETAYDVIQEMRRIYAGTIGFDYAHVRHPEEREWLRAAAESRCFRPPNDPINPIWLLERLTQVEVFEHFLHRVFPGKTRFSIEGLDMIVPILDELVGAAAEDDICMVFLGMAHRGRLNVLAHVQNKSYQQILAEFKDPGINFVTREEFGWMGDVKYHKGALRAHESGETVNLLVCMPPNPSHLEHINPVLQGMARAADTQADRPGSPRLFPKASLPIIIHGDASFPGQGIVAETLNLSRLEGYQTFGAIHIIANNQLGYTANPDEARSTLYAADLAKGFKIPIIYAKADDPESCIEAARTASAYRARFHKDFLIDIIGYRRYGHNEGDEPSFTQPLIYEKIRSHPTVRQLWSEVLIQRGEIVQEQPQALYDEQMKSIQQVYDRLQPDQDLDETLPEPPPSGAARSVKTGVPLDRLRDLNDALLKLPDDFNLNRKLERGMERQRQVFRPPSKDGKQGSSQEATIQWAAAEDLALASILEDGIPVRLTGEDVIRGTFSQRHAAFYDVKTDRPYIPLQKLPQAKASFEIYNTPVTENATLGFEFGYNIQAPGRLVIWEAQYGDFVNVAQAIIDEFIVSARVKWGQLPSLVLLLPHGNEGQGPDHSSGRPERFLQMAENNIRIAYPTTAAQYFHLLRRQALLLKTDPLPLVVLTPKGLLRHPLTASKPSELEEGGWQPVIDDPDRSQDRDAVRRLILCSGRVYADLAASEKRGESPEIAIARLEQLYPFPDEEVTKLVRSYPKIEQVIWLQEEPRNMGFWSFVRPRIETILGELPLEYIGRLPSSSPAEGSASMYSVQQRRIIEAAFQAGEGELTRPAGNSRARKK
jgi:2-oxoglutarate dehydrogenase E1 component